MFMVQYVYDDGKYLMSVWIYCTTCNTHIHCDMSYKVTKDNITVFIKVLVFHHVDRSWLIKTQ